MASFMTKIRIVLLTLGILALTIMIYQVGPQTIFIEIKSLGLALLIIYIPYLISYSCDTLGWRATLAGYRRHIAFKDLFLARIAGETVNNLTPLAYLGGEPVKAYILLHRFGVPLVQGLASVVIAKTTMTIAEIIFILLGIMLASFRIEGGGPLLSLLLLVLLGGIISVGLFFLAQRRGLFGGFLSLLGRLGIRIPFLMKREESLRSLDRAISDFYIRDRRSFFRSLSFFLLGWIAGAFEVYLLLYFLHIPIDLSVAIIIEALASMIKSVAFLIPGAVGAQEGGNLLIFTLFGLAASTGITFSLIRRIRELCIIGVGLLVLSKYEMKVSSLIPPSRGDEQETSAAGIP